MLIISDSLQTRLYMKIQLATITALLIFMTLPLSGQTLITLPDDYNLLDGLEGTIVELRQRLYVVDNSNWNRYGEVVLASERLLQPTEIALPASVEYFSQKEHNSQCTIVLDDGSDDKYPTPRPWASADGTLRCGAYTTHLVGRLTNESWGYTITPTQTVTFENNTRPTSTEIDADYDVKICGFNLEYYMVDDFSTSVGPENQTEADRQHNKISKALKAIGADVFGLVEVQQGNEAAQKLVAQLNSDFPDRHYTYIADGTQMNGTWTRACFIYRDDILIALREQQSDNTGVRYRKKVQGFEMKSSGERFIVMLGHFKAKSGTGTGDNADQNDGQGIYNGDRTREAAAMVTLGRSCQTYYSDPDLIMMGDLNSYSREDPIRCFTSAGYRNMIKHFGGDTAYSYRYRTTVGCLDHALANASMAQQMVECRPFHINTDEPSVFGYDGYDYQNNMYRSSDHDPIIAYIKLDRTASATNEPHTVSPIVYTGHGIVGIAGADSRTLHIYTADGRLIEQHYITSADFTLTTDHLTQGIYIFRITTPTTASCHKVVVE